MGIITGPPVSGENLLYRKREIAEIHELLDSGNNVLLIGLRRIGKSSVMKGVCEKASSGWMTSYQDLQGKSYPSEFFTALLKSLPEDKRQQAIAVWSRAKTIPDNIINKIKSHMTKLGGLGVNVEFQKDVIDYWGPLTGGVEKTLKEMKKPALLVFDEFPVFLENMIKHGIKPLEVESILFQLQAWINNNQQLKLLIGGSISLDRVLAKNEISGDAIEVFERYSLKPWDKDTALSFLDKMAVKEKMDWFSDEMKSEAVSLLDDYYPFFLQAFLRQIKMNANPNASGRTKSLQEIFENEFIPSIRRRFFQQFFDRLDKHYDEKQQKVSKAILDSLSSAEGYKLNYSQLRVIHGETDHEKDVELDMLLYDLIGDEFLSCDSSSFEYTFTTKLVARWWFITRGRR